MSAASLDTRRMIDARDISLSKRIAALGFLLVAYFFYAWSWNTVDILRPYIKDSLDLSLTQSGSLYTLQSVGAIAGAVIMGQVADKIGCATRWSYQCSAMARACCQHCS